MLIKKLTPTPTTTHTHTPTPSSSNDSTPNSSIHNNELGITLLFLKTLLKNPNKEISSYEIDIIRKTYELIDYASKYDEDSKKLDPIKDYSLLGCSTLSQFLEKVIFESKESSSFSSEFTKFIATHKDELIEKIKRIEETHPSLFLNAIAHIDWLQAEIDYPREQITTVNWLKKGKKETDYGASLSLATKTNTKSAKTQKGKFINQDRGLVCKLKKDITDSNLYQIIQQVQKEIETHPSSFTTGTTMTVVHVTQNEKNVRCIAFTLGDSPTLIVEHHKPKIYHTCGISREERNKIFSSISPNHNVNKAWEQHLALVNGAQVDVKPGEPKKRLLDNKKNPSLAPSRSAGDGDIPNKIEDISITKTSFDLKKCEKLTVAVVSDGLKVEKDPSTFETTGLTNIATRQEYSAKNMIRAKINKQLDKFYRDDDMTIGALTLFPSEEKQQFIMAIMDGHGISEEGLASEVGKNTLEKILKEEDYIDPNSITRPLKKEKLKKISSCLKWFATCL